MGTEWGKGGRVLAILAMEITKLKFILTILTLALMMLLTTSHEKFSTLSNFYREQWTFLHLSFSTQLSYPEKT